MHRIDRIEMPAPEGGFPKNSAPDDIFQGAVVRTVSEDALLDADQLVSLSILSHEYFFVKSITSCKEVIRNTRSGRSLLEPILFRSIHNPYP